MAQTAQTAHQVVYVKFLCTDAVRIISLCRPLRRSLRRLVLSHNWDLVSVSRIAWKRLIDQGRLNLLYLHDTGIQISQPDVND